MRTTTRKTLLASLLLLLAGAATPLRSGPPPWWAARGVTNARPADDYAAVNQGQLKNIAAQAAAELNARLPGGAGPAVNALVTGWSQPPAPGKTRDEFATVNLGQLKTVAKPFYDRLMAAGYATRYPWTGQEARADDFAAANIGQVKNLFSFDVAFDGDGDGVADWLNDDPDGDGVTNGQELAQGSDPRSAALDPANGLLPLDWEKFYGVPAGTNPNALAPRGDGLTYLQAFQRRLNPNDFFNGQRPALAIVSGDAQTGAPGGFVPLALVVSVLDGGGNQNPYSNAPVTFTVSQGGGTVQRSNLAAAGTSVTVLADSRGQARVFFRLPDVAGSTSQVTAGTVGGGGSSSPPTRVFTERSAVAGSPGDYPSPFAPTLQAATANADGSADISWTNNTDPADTEPIVLQYQNREGQWTTLATVPAGTTHYHIPAP